MSLARWCGGLPLQREAWPAGHRVEQQARVWCFRIPENLVCAALLDAFSQAGLNSEEIVRHYALYSLHILSSASAIARRRSAELELGIDERRDAFRAWFDVPHSLNPRKHPRTVELSSQIMKPDERDLFQRGVEAVIQSAESRVPSV